jgi:hypothetical protein
MTLWEREGDVLVAEDGRMRAPEDFDYEDDLFQAASPYGVHPGFDRLSAKDCPATREAVAEKVATDDPAFADGCCPLCGKPDYEHRPEQ